MSDEIAGIQALRPLKRHERVSNAKKVLYRKVFSLKTDHQAANEPPILILQIAHDELTETGICPDLLKHIAGIVSTSIQAIYE